MMTDNEKAAYQGYVSMCLFNNMKPLSFDDWCKLIEGKLPESLFRRESR